MRIPFLRTKRPDSFWLFAICASAVLLRILYLSDTTWDARGHDAPGHLDYVVHVAMRLSLPEPDHGFEFYQPPLYYMLAAPAVWMSWAPQVSEQTRNVLVQLFSLACSLVTFWAGMRIGRRLLPGKDALPLHLFAILLATVPSFVFFAARVNNDVLYQAWAFLAFLLLLKWWNGKDPTLWLVLCAVLGLGILTKTNMALIAFPCFLCLLLDRAMPWKTKVAQGAAGVAVILLVAGWFHVPRALDDDGRKAVVGNYEQLTNFVENDAAKYLVFNPVAMLGHPYNDPYDDAARRQYFWEYFYRSALYGEFHFGDDRVKLALAMLLSSLLLLPFLAFNLVSDIRGNAYRTLPAWGTFLFLMAGAAAFRFVFPYSSSQDFRYSILLLPIAAAYAVRDTGARNPLFRRAQIVLTAAFGIAATGFLLTL